MSIFSRLLNVLATFDIDSEKSHNQVLTETGFWGKAGAGTLIFCITTGRFLVPKRSKVVEQPLTYGVWGGAIDRGKSPLEAVQQEVAEECGYTGKYRIIPLYIFKHPSGFRYYNHISLVINEFEPELNWETIRAQWITYNQLKRLPNKHFGLKALLSDPKSKAIIERLVQKIESRKK